MPLKYDLIHLLSQLEEHMKNGELHEFIEEFAPDLKRTLSAVVKHLSQMERKSA